MSRESIVFNFNKAKQNADKLDDIADDLVRMVKNEYDSVMQTIANNWKGDNAAAYLKKGEVLQSNMTTSASQLRNEATRIRAIALNIYEAEMEALRIAEERQRAAERQRADSKKS